MLTYKIPKTSIFLQTVNVFGAVFNNPTAGIYDFVKPSNLANPVLKMETNRIYLINRITIGGTIPQEEYLFNIVQLPKMLLQFSIENQRVYSNSIPIVQFVDGMEAVTWFWTDKGDESLTMSIIAGQLSQDSFLVGTQEIKLNITMSIFEITDIGFCQDFKRDNSETLIGGKSRMITNNKIMAVV